MPLFSWFARSASSRCCSSAVKLSVGPALPPERISSSRFAALAAGQRRLQLRRLLGRDEVGELLHHRLARHVDDLELLLVVSGGGARRGRRGGSGAPDGELLVAVVLGDRPLDLELSGDRELHLRARLHLDLVEQLEVGRVGDRDLEQLAAVLERDREDALLLGEADVDSPERAAVAGEVAEPDPRGAGGLGDRLGDHVLLGEAEVDDDAGDAAAPLVLARERRAQLQLVDHLGPDEDLTHPAARAHGRPHPIGGGSDGTDRDPGRELPLLRAASVAQLDAIGASSEQFTQDCEVCCRPWVVTVSRTGDEVTVALAREDD